MFDHEPDANEIRTLWEQMKRYYSNMHHKMESAKALYRHDFSWLHETVPEGVDIHEPSTASSIIDHFRDNIRIQQIIPQRADWGTTKKAREHKALLLRLDSYILDKIRGESPVNPFGQVVFDMSGLGAAAWGFHFDESKWPDLPEDEEERKIVRAERGMSWPFVVTPIDPMGIMPAPGGDFPLPWCIEWQVRTAAEVKRRYPEWADKNQLLADPTVSVDVIQFYSAPYKKGKDWVPGWYVVVVDEDAVITGENPYGLVPYVFEYSGMGRLDRSGDPKHLAVNLLEHAESEIKAEARVRTAMDAAWQFTVFPRLLTTEDPRMVKIRWDLSAGGVLQVKGLGPNEKPQWLEQPQIDAAMFQFLPVLTRSIERATFSSVLEGQRTEGVDFGYLQALLVGQASLRKDNIVGMAGRLFAHGVSLIERMMVHLELSSITLGPGTEGEASRTIQPVKDIGNRFELSVIIEAADPAEKDRRMLSWLSPLRAQVIPKRMYLEEGMMVDNPNEILDELYAEMVVEQIIQSGQMAQEILAALASEERTGVLESAAQEQVQSAQAERPPGVPPTQESPVARTPMSVIKSMQSVDQRAISLKREG